jgi:DNA-binding PadR family transcriptional regulator
MASRADGELVRGNLELMVLSVLVDEEGYGYLIQQRLRCGSGGLVDVPAGTLYPLLHRLEGDQLVRSRWDDSAGRRRKWYELTAAGQRRLWDRACQWKRLAECLDRLLAPVLDAPQPA